MKLRVNRLHVRYEDDYFNADSPFSFGLVINVLWHVLTELQKLVWESSDQKWKYESVN